jgi:nitric oxide reductase NorQ protein
MAQQTNPDGSDQKITLDRVQELVKDDINTNQDLTEALDASVGHVGRKLKEWTEEGELDRTKIGHAYEYSVPENPAGKPREATSTHAPPTTPGQDASRHSGGDALRAPVDRDYQWNSFVPAGDEVAEYISHNGEKREIELEIAAIQQWVHGVHADLRDQYGEDPTPEQVTSECRRRENAEDDYAPRLPRYMIDGPTGCGKTTLAESIAAHPPDAARAGDEMGWPVIEIQFTYDMSPAELLGSPQLVGGSTVWEDGGLTKALLASREGPVVVILDEVPRARPEVHSTLMDALDHRARVKLTGRGHEAIQGVPYNLVTVATANLGDEYQHFEMDPAHKRRLGDRHSVDYLGVNYPHREADLVAERTGCPSRLSDLLVEVANQVRERAGDPTSDVRFGVPTAALLDWAQKSRSLAAHDVDDMDGVENPIVQAALGTVVRRWYDGNQAEADTVRQIVKDNLDGCPYGEDAVAAWAGEQEYVVCGDECGYQAPVSEAEQEGVLDFMECPSCDNHVERKTSQEMQNEGRL